MDLLFNLLLIILIELPIVGFFFKKRKRRAALMTGLFANIITWPIVNIIRLNTDWNANLVLIGVMLVEGFIYWFILGKNIKKSTLITITANLASFFITKFVYLPADFFQKKSDIIL
jgi:hypothetical protein